MRVDEARIGKPCGEDWGAMAGDRVRRHCASCDKHVHDLSAMSEGAARRLLRRSPGICVRYTCRADGSIVHREHRPGPRQLPPFVALAGAMVAAAPAWGSPAAATIPEVEEVAKPTLVERVMETVSGWFAKAPKPPEIILMGAPPPLPPEEVVMMGDVAPPAPKAEETRPDAR